MAFLGQINSRNPGPPAVEPGAVFQQLSAGRDPVRFLRRPEVVLAFKGRDELSLFYESHPCAPDGGCDAAAVLGYVAHIGTTQNPGELAHSLLSRWREKGTAFLKDLEGSFALILYDAMASRLLIAADCQSSRAIWYAKTMDGMIVGTDVRCVCAMLPQAPVLDKAYLWSFLLRSCTVENRSPFEQVRALDAGEAMEFRNGSLHWQGRYTEPLFAPQQRPVNDTAAELAHGIQKTIAEGCLGRQSPCLFLSGGLDSRLVAGACPEGVSALTLCDSLNRETAMAARVAKVCGLKHRILIRDSEWYPGLLESGSLCSNGVWAWNEAHYVPLAEPKWDFAHDAAILGFGSNTYFKGTLLEWPRLWEKVPGGSGSLDEYLFQLIMESPPFSPQAELILKPGARAECEQAYREAARRVVGQVGRWASTIPDMWELFWSNSLTGVIHALNLSCLRSFTAERNAFNGRRLRQLYFSIPSQQRAQGLIVRKALQHVDPRLAMIPDANSWLPAGFPPWTHAAAMVARGHVAAARGYVLGRMKSRNYISHCSWPHFGRLWFVSERMRTTMEELIRDESALPDNIFDRDAIRRLWAMTLEGRPAPGHLLDALATFGIYHRAVMNRR